MDNTFMKEKPVFPLLLSMSLPMILSMLVNSLYNIIDSFFVAKISESAMTALSLVYPVQNFINAVAIGFGVGINVVIAFYLGAESEEMADRAASRGFFYSCLMGIIMTIGCCLIIPAFLKMFTSDETVIAMGTRYARIVFIFTLAVCANLVFEKIFQALGRMKLVMVAMIVGCVTNIILDPMMIFGIGPFPKLEITGAALATGIGQMVTLVIYLVAYFARPCSVRIKGKYLFKFDRVIDARLYQLGIPASLNLALPSLLISALNAILAAFSPVYVVVLGIYYKLQTFLYIPASGLVQGMRPLVGYNYGAGEMKRVGKICRAALLTSGLILAAGTGICFAIPGQLIGMFTENPETIAAGSQALRLISIGFIVSAVSVTYSGALEGLGKGMPSLMISLCRYTIIIIPAAFLFSRIWEAAGVWHAFWFTEAVSALISYIIYKKELHKKELQKD